MDTGSFRLDPDGIYRCEAFQNFMWQKHGFGTRHANPAADVTLRQTHSDHVLNARGLGDREAQGDSLITDEIGRSVGVRTADCVPILLLDSRTHAVAAVHAGWRGTAANLVQRTLDSMSAAFNSNPSDIYAALGPCIRACCYEVGAGVASQFASLFPEWDTIAGPRKLDLIEANRRHLQAAGVAAERIFDCGLCTSCQSDQFFSYRREPRNPGRMIAAISRLA